eukprot:Hpha_TRINITY_DN30143_c0_g1::TRINITY_DN30143_c0_g1_i1::g.110704::m.110704
MPRLRISVDGRILLQETPVIRFRRTGAVFLATSTRPQLVLQQEGAGSLLIDAVRLSPVDNLEKATPRPRPDPLSESVLWPLTRGQPVVAVIGSSAGCGSDQFVAALTQRHGWRQVGKISRDVPVGLVVVVGCESIVGALTAAAEGLWPHIPGIVACARSNVEARECTIAGAHRVLRHDPRRGTEQVAEEIALAAADAAALAGMGWTAYSFGAVAFRGRTRADEVSRRLVSVSSALRVSLPEEPSVSVFPPDVLSSVSTTGLLWPEMCGVNVTPDIMYYAHTLKREGEYTPAEYFEEMLTLAGRQNSSVVDIKVLEGSRLGAIQHDFPLTYPKGESIFTPWDLYKNCSRMQDSRDKEKVQCEVMRWTVEWHRDPSEASSMPQVLPPQPPLWIALIRDAFVDQGYVLACDRVFERGGCIWNVHVAMAPLVVERALVVCDNSCNGYFHFLQEHLPRIIPLLPLLSDPRTKIIIPPQGNLALKPFVANFFLEVLNVSSEQIILETTVYAKWVYYTQPTPCGNIHTSALHLMRGEVFRRLGLRHVVDYPLRRNFVVLLAVRRSTLGPLASLARMPADWSETLALLHRYYGDRPRVEIREFDSKMSTADQIRQFHSADMVIGPHGANLANTLWLRHGATVLEFASKRYGNMCYFTTSSRLGLRHRFLLHQALKGSANYSASFEELHAHIEDALASAESPGRRSTLEPV